MQKSSPDHGSCPSASHRCLLKKRPALTPWWGRVARGTQPCPLHHQGSVQLRSFSLAASGVNLPHLCSSLVWGHLFLLPPLLSSASLDQELCKQLMLLVAFLVKSKGTRIVLGWGSLVGTRLFLKGWGHLCLHPSSELRITMAMTVIDNDKEVGNHISVIIN